MSIRLTACVPLLWQAGSVQAHEFWIEPVKFEVSLDTPLQADLRNGERFAGDAFPYMPGRFQRFTLRDDVESRLVNGRLGDFPALDQEATRSGLHTISYQSEPSLLVYDSYEKFTRFAEEEGIEWLVAQHDQRGLSRLGIAEQFQRFAKSLVYVNPDSDERSAEFAAETFGADQHEGMLLELVALDSPYRHDACPLDVQLLFDGEPLPDTQLSVFHRDATDIVSVERLRSDSSGSFSVACSKPGDYLLNAVHVRQASTTIQFTNAVWESLWASLTFAIADR